MNGRVERLLWWATLAWCVALFWIAPRPAMVDLPQHAAQVALLRDLLSGSSPWLAAFRINWLAPYLVGDMIALALTLLMPVAAALKLALSLAYCAFIAALVALRRHFDADARLDWRLLLPFFGYAFAWGLFPFLISAPVAICLILALDRYCLRPSSGRGAITALLALVLLSSHGLTFIFCMAVAGCLYTARMRTPAAWLRHLWPLLLPGLAAIASFIISTRLQQQFGGIDSVGPLVWNLGWKRIPKLLLYSLGSDPEPALIPAMLVLPLLPWMLGLRVARERLHAGVLLAVTLLVSLTVPVSVMGTGLVYTRFALFVLPGYALLFAARAAAPVESGAGGHGMLTLRRPTAGQRMAVACAVPLAVVVTWIVLGMHTVHAVRFAREAADFEPILAAMAPAQRAISLSFSPQSDSAGNSMAYLHFASWYQAEKHGWVDFNFAWFPEQIVRFQSAYLPAIGYNFDHAPASFDWQKHQAQSYRYFVVRHDSALPASLFAGADCAPVVRLVSGAWTLFEQGHCKIGTPPGRAP